MYFSLPPSFLPSEIDMSLPCDDALWSAGDSRGWYNTVQSPSAYGTGNARITGFSMKSALAVLGDTRLSTASLSLNPFAHFILIHTILRNIYASQTDGTSASSGDPASSPKRTSVDISAVDNEDLPCFRMQYALHNWLQSWLNSPEAMQMDNNKRTSFVHDALPFYWLAQVSLLAAQDDVNGGGAVFGDSMCEGGRFRLLKAWLDHIRTFLRRENQVPTHLWDELVKIRMNISVDHGRAGDEHALGLLAHFPRN